MWNKHDMRPLLLFPVEDDAKLPAELYLELEIAMPTCRKPIYTDWRSRWSPRSIYGL